MRCVAVSLVTVCFIAGCGPSGAHGKYPPPTTRLLGQTADQWAEEAEDLDTIRCVNACKALQQLGDEGVPYLLAAAEKQKSMDNVAWCLNYLEGSLVEDQDLGRVAAFLGAKYAPYDGNSLSPRVRALFVLGQVGPRAKRFLPQIRALLQVEKLKGAAEGAVEKIEK